MEKLIKFGMLAVGGIAIIALLAVVMAFPFMWCWNAVIPYLFGLKTLTWGKAWCLMFVSTSLFKSGTAIKS